MEHETESEVRDGKGYFCSANCHRRGRKSLGHDKSCNFLVCFCRKEELKIIFKFVLVFKS